MAGLGDMMAVGVLRADDYDRAKKFYTEVLGLKPEEATGPTREGRFWAGSDTMVSIYERPGFPAPQNTTLAFRVPADRFEAVAQDLRAKGVVFEVYQDMPGVEWKYEVASIPDMGRAAWFKDSEGNIMCLDEGVPRT